MPRLSLSVGMGAARPGGRGHGARPPVLAQVVNLLASAASATEIDLTWDAQVPASGYEVEQSLDGVTWGAPAAVIPNAYAATGLVGATQYFFRVRSTASGDPGPWSATATATTSAAGNGLLNGLALYAKTLDETLTVGGGPLTNANGVTFDATGALTGEGRTLKPGAPFLAGTVPAVTGAPWSFFARVRLNDITQGGHIFTLLAASPLQLKWKLAQSAIAFEGAGNYEVTAAPTGLSNGDWLSISGVFHADHTTLRVNDTDAGSETFDNTTLYGATYSRLEVGQSPQFGVTNNLDIAALGFWSRELTSGEETALHNSGTTLKYASLSAPVKAGLANWWDFAEAADASRADAAGAITLLSKRAGILRVAADTGFAARFLGPVGHLTLDPTAILEDFGSSDWLLSAWAYCPDSLTQNPNLSVGENNTNGFDLGIDQTGAAGWEMPMSDNSYPFCTSAAAAVAANTWQNILIWWTVSDKTLHLRVGGNEFTQVSAVGTGPADPTSALSLFGQWASLGIWKGTIPDAAGRLLLAAGTPYASFTA